MRKIAPAIAFAAAAAALALTACSSGKSSSSSSSSATARAGGTLVYATGDAEPTCLDPQTAGTVEQALLGNQYLETLFYQNKDGKILPWLAKSWQQSPDGLSWTINVRDDVKFSDGTPLDASAVKINIDRILAPATKSNTARLALSKVKSVDVVSPDTARINLSTPDSALLQSLAMVWLPIESPAGLARGFDANCQAPIGSGPFEVQRWTKQSDVTFVRNPNYTTPPPGSAHSGPAYLDKIVWRFVPDSTSRFAALQSGQAQVVDVLAAQDAVAIKGNSSLTTLSASRPGEPLEIELNSKRAPFDDQSVREAFFAAVDVQSALTSVYLGTEKPATSLLSSATRYQINSVQHIFDLAKANRLLDQAGWTTRDSAGYRTKNGNRLTVSLPTAEFIPIAQGVYEQIQATAKKAGFDVQIKPLEYAAWWQVNYKWDYDAIPVYYTKNDADVLRITYSTAALAEATPGSYHANNIGLKSTQVDGLLNEASQTTDDARRADLYKQVQQTISAGYYTLPLFDQKTELGLQKKVQGLRITPGLAMPYFYDSWLNS